MDQALAKPPARPLLRVTSVGAGLYSARLAAAVNAERRSAAEQAAAPGHCRSLAQAGHLRSLAQGGATGGPFAVCRGHCSYRPRYELDIAHCAPRRQPQPLPRPLPAAGISAHRQPQPLPRPLPATA
eukprot:365676-Chlamydomonas_euryale.AAC.2